MPRITHEATIVIVGGAGTMGSSTALHLARRGYKSIRILDIFQPPSANSAGNDMNKLISTQYVDGIWGRLAFETWDAWCRDELFRPFLHTTGRVDLATSSSAREKTLRRQFERSRDTGRSENVAWLDSREEIVTRAPCLENAQLQGMRGLWIRDAGWMAARDALDAIGQELRRLSVKSSFGSSGTFKSLLLASDGVTVRGVKMEDGSEWEADLVIMAAGAWTPTILDLDEQCQSKAWQYGHVRLNREERQRLKGMPAIYCQEIGFTMEPSEDGVMKWVNEFQGYTRYSECQPFGSAKPQRISVPRSHAVHPSDTIPDEGHQAIEQTIRTFMPGLSHKELFNKALCWCADSFDGNWLLCEDPRYTGLILATGDSGHTFKMLPIVGKYVCDLIEGKLSSEDKALWQWRPNRRRSGDLGREGDAPRDLGDLSGWRHGDNIPTASKQMSV